MICDSAAAICCRLALFANKISKTKTKLKQLPTGAPLWIIAAAIGVVVLIAVIVVAVMLRSFSLHQVQSQFVFRRKRSEGEPVRNEA